jgi:hypothetical protein
MTKQQLRTRVRYVIGRDGSPLTIADLPPMNVAEWLRGLGLEHYAPGVSRQRY